MAGLAARSAAIALSAPKRAIAAATSKVLFISSYDVASGPLTMSGQFIAEKCRIRLATALQASRLRHHAPDIIRLVVRRIMNNDTCVNVFAKGENSAAWHRTRSSKQDKRLLQRDAIEAAHNSEPERSAGRSGMWGWTPPERPAHWSPTTSEAMRAYQCREGACRSGAELASTRPDALFRDAIPVSGRARSTSRFVSTVPGLRCRQRR